MANAESKVQKKLMEALSATFPKAYIRKIAQSMYSHGGVPDLICCIDGEFVGIEVKTNTGKMSKLQERECRLIEDAGGLFFACYGEKDIKYILSVLESITK